MFLLTVMKEWNELVEENDERQPVDIPVSFNGTWAKTGFTWAKRGFFERKICIFVKFFFIKAWFKHSVYVFYNHWSVTLVVFVFRTTLNGCGETGQLLEYNQRQIFLS